MFQFDCGFPNCAKINGRKVGTNVTEIRARMLKSDITNALSFIIAGGRYCSLLFLYSRRKERGMDPNEEPIIQVKKHALGAHLMMCFFENSKYKRRRINGKECRFKKSAEGSPNAGKAERADFRKENAAEAVKRKGGDVSEMV